MKGFFDAEKVDVPCPGCGHKVTKTVGWMKRSPEWTCAGCGRDVKLDASQVARSLKQVDDAISQLERTLKKFGK